MPRTKNVITDADGRRRCWWCGDDALYMHYHDTEWGRPTADDVKLFEKICLEGFQAGLSWITILRKREAFRKALRAFDFEKVAKFSASQVDQLLGNANIVRHRGKIESSINNAQRALEMVDRYGSIASFLWRFEPRKSPVLRSRNAVRATTDESTALSKELKRLGWTFVGPTTCYALMQAMGMVNDHLRTCDCWPEVDHARREFQRPA